MKIPPKRYNFGLCGFTIRIILLVLGCWGITNPPVLIGRTFFYAGFQIRRDAWLGTGRLAGEGLAGFQIRRDGRLFNLVGLTSVRRSADLQSAVKKCPNLFGLCGFTIRIILLVLGCWGDYKSPGFNRSNLFLRRISNPAGRLAGDGTPSGGDFQPASSSSSILFGWERDRFPGRRGGEPD